MRLIMKHVFFVSSNLTFFVANKIITIDNLNRNDCCLFMVRNYHIPQPYSELYQHQISTGYNVEQTVGRVFAGINICQTKRNVSIFDSLIDAFLHGEDFIWYTSVCSNDICSLMVTKPNCKGYYVVEDGLASYRNYNPQTFTGWRYFVYKILLKPFFPRIFEVKNHFITTQHPKFKGCIATSTQCFPLHQQYLRVIGFPFEPTIDAQHFDAIISIDPLYTYINYDATDGLFCRLAQFMADKHYNSVAYKFHPRFNSANNKEHKDKYQDFIAKYLPNAIELDNSIILESLLAATQADFYTYSSSVVLYVNQLGVKSYSYMGLLKNTPAYLPNELLDQYTIPIVI